MAVTHCRYFNGYKPCEKNSRCDQACSHLDEVEEAILIVHLGALGAVVRSTSLLPGIIRKHPRAKIIWVTEKAAMPLLQASKKIDMVVAADGEGIISLKSFEFDHAYVIDKSLKAAGIVQSLKVKHITGFKAHPKTGAIVPATASADELWSLGLDNNKKFFENSKPETQLVFEALELGSFKRDEYQLPMDDLEKKQAELRHRLWSLEGKKCVIGVNTGCSPVIPYKKLSVEFQKKICQILSARPDVRVVLLGGPEDTERNAQIAEGLNIIQSDTERGLRDGLISVAACDVVLTGDSLGMHLAIAQKKWTVAWFGPTCAHEIDLYDRGVKVMTKAPCAPCWKRSCQKDSMCYDQVDFLEVLEGIEKGIQNWQQQKPTVQPTLLSKRPSSEICS